MRILEKSQVSEMLEECVSAACELAYLEQFENQLKPLLNEAISICAKATTFFFQIFAVGSMTRYGLRLLEVMENSKR
jgi:hypothetical protein